MDLTAAVLTEHAEAQMAQRQVTPAEVQQVLAAPAAVSEVHPGRVVAQGMIGEYLLRIFVDVDRAPAEVVTAYRTSKIDKYTSH